MGVEVVKNTLVALTLEEREEVSAFLFHLRHVSDEDYQKKVESRISDRQSNHWLTPEEFERQLDAK